MAQNALDRLMERQALLKKHGLPAERLAEPKKRKRKKKKTTKKRRKKATKKRKKKKAKATKKRKKATKKRKKKKATKKRKKKKAKATKKKWPKWRVSFKGPRHRTTKEKFFATKDAAQRFIARQPAGTFTYLDETPERMSWREEIPNPKKKANPKKAKRPPKGWWDDCVESVTESAKKAKRRGKKYAKNPAAVCGDTWYHEMSQADRRAAAREHE